MKYNDTTNKTGIIQMIERTTGLGLGFISGTASELAYFTNLVNQWLQIGHFYAMQTNKHWHFDDSNHNDFPLSTTDLVDNQRDYTQPSTLYRIRNIEIMDKAGNYQTIEELADDSPALYSEREQETAGIPTHYYKRGNSIILYPKPNTAMVTATAGLRILHDRKMVLFTTADTTQEPGFDELLHPICYYGPSWEWAGVNGDGNVMETCDRMLGQFPGIREIFERHFASKDRNDVPKISRANKSYR